MKPAPASRERDLESVVVDRLALLEPEEFAGARRIAKRLGIGIEQAVAERGRIPLPFLLKQLADAWGIGFTELRIADVDREALRLVREDFARKSELVAFRADRAQVHVAMADPHDRSAIEAIARSTSRRVVRHLAPRAAIRRAHLLYEKDVLGLGRCATEETDEQATAAAAAALATSAVELVDRVLRHAVLSEASDVHVEPFRTETVIRCRVDGMLNDVLHLPPSAHAGIAARIKVLCNMRLDERRVPQDGRFDADPGGTPIDCRVSTVPSLWGEKLVLRILPRETMPLDLDHLGLSEADYPRFVRNLMRPHGMLLLTGPTGSGKTTTLYGMVMQLAAERHNLINISTIEDPVEYTIPRVVQIPLNAETGIGFASGLRALLRQDPDVIMVGEIRDRETADIGVRAALVGRLLLSTLHTNDATSAVARLLDMGVEPYLLASTLALVVGQRLVRRICVHCRQSCTAGAEALESLARRSDFEQTVAVLRRDGVLSQSADPFAALHLFRGKGCDYCNGSGFRGRIGIFELFEVDDAIRPMILRRADAAEIRATAIAAGMRTLFQDGLAKALAGETTIEEVFRVSI